MLKGGISLLPSIMKLPQFLEKYLGITIPKYSIKLVLVVLNLIGEEGGWWNLPMVNGGKTWNKTILLRGI